jgi:signal transduction histidine kinase
MKPLMSENEDNDALRALGRASVQIVHDLKNQLNGLKLYATFLRKRLEKSERPADELDTIKKLIAGLDRTAADLSLIVEYGQPIELKKRAGSDLEKIIRGVAAGLNDSPRATGALVGPIIIESEPTQLIGDFDPTVLSDALKVISLGALKLITNKSQRESLTIHLKREAIEAQQEGVIEWRVFDSLDHDPFHSFAGSDEIRMSLAAKVIELHGGSAERRDGTLRVRLPLGP